eukprot:7510200-Heterocapsa_arctica.AAC.1
MSKEEDGEFPGVSSQKRANLRAEDLHQENGTGDIKKKRRLIITGASRRRNTLQGSKKRNTMKIKSLTDRLSELGSLTLD